MSSFCFCRKNLEILNSSYNMTMKGRAINLRINSDTFTVHNCSGLSINNILCARLYPK